MLLSSNKIKLIAVIALAAITVAGCILSMYLLASDTSIINNSSNADELLTKMEDMIENKQ